MNEKKPDHADLHETPRGRPVLAVKLGVVSIEAAMRGAALLVQKTPEWVEERAATDDIMLSKQEHSDLAHLWVATPSGRQLCQPNEWLLNVNGELHIMHNQLFRHLFPLALEACPETQQ